MIESATAFRPGDRVDLDFGEGRRVSAVVRWSDEERFGVAFDEPIEIEQFNAQRQLRSTG